LHHWFARVTYVCMLTRSSMLRLALTKNLFV